MEDFSSSEEDDDLDLAYQLEQLHFSNGEKKAGESRNGNDPSTSGFRPRNVNDGSIRKKVQAPLHEKEALKLLRDITGKSTTELTKALYKAAMLPKTHEDYGKILEYVKNGQNHGFGIEVINIIRIVRNNDFEFDNRRSHHNLRQSRSTKQSAATGVPGQRLPPFLGQLVNQNANLPQPPPPPSRPKSSKESNFRMILFHGTKKAYTASIIMNGFAIPPRKNQMFGTGIYFADRASKSAQYCDSTAPGQLGYMFLCDVKLGKMFKAFKAHLDYVQSPSGFDTVKCCGKNRPDWKHNGDIRGAIVPLGPTCTSDRFETHTLVFNEYIAYEAERVKAKYLVVVKFHASKRR